MSSTAASAGLAGRRALVTGASRGIGAAIAGRLASLGAHVGLVARSATALEDVAEEIRAAGGAASVVAVDVTDREGSEEAVRRFLDLHGRVDVLVNNAGGNVRKDAEDYSHAEWDALLALGLSAPFHWSCLCAPGMRATGRGRIVSVGSVAGLRALPTGAPYAAAKAGLVQLTRSLAREWGGDGITVNLVAPWYVKTPLTEDVLAQPDYLEAVLACTPTGRIGTAEDVAAAVAFLCGDEAGWINGVCLPLDGGFTGAAFFPQ